MYKQTDFENMTGLSQVEASNILKTEGYNELPSQKNRSNLAILLRILSEPMLLLLMACGAIYLLMGEPKDALMLLSFVFVVIGITFYQERKTEKTLEALKNLSSPRAIVIRDKKQVRIPGREVVKGDLIIIREGDRVPADAVVLFCENLTVDESLLTGESVAVRKSTWDGKMSPHKPGGEDLPFIFSGSLIIGGHGFAKVRATGLNTEIGKIGKSLEIIKDEDTLLRIETAKVVRLVASVGLFLCLIVILIYVLIKGQIIEGILAGLTLSMSILPEEIPVILMIFLTLGAWRISKRNVLTRRPAAIETLGAATVLCTDKTGTLTLNKMELSCLGSENNTYNLNGGTYQNLDKEYQNVLEYGILASQKDPFDPIEKELIRVGELYIKDSEYIKRNLNSIKEYPITKDLLALSYAWQISDECYIIASKGAPESILELCHANENEKSHVLGRVKEMTAKGLRVLGVAKTQYSNTKLPSDQHDFSFEFVGLLGFVDPPRPTANIAVKEAYDAGMRVIMITGDYPGTAQFIANKIGLKHSENILTGDDLERMSARELTEKIKYVNIFARVIPEQKLDIVNALKANGEIVAMTGDGVNDAPALKAAHIGIAMGERGTDVAREASSLVLLDDDFSSIVAAVRLGRRIYDNLKRAMGYTVAVHVPIAGMAMLPLLFGYPIVLLPAHIAFLELIINPTCSTVFEAEKEDDEIMKRPPRGIRQPMFNYSTVVISILQGTGALVVTFLLYSTSLNSGRTEVEARSIAFASMVISNLFLILSNLSWSNSIVKIIISANKTLIFVIVGALISLAGVLYIPFLSNLFHLGPIQLNDFVLITSAAFIGIVWFEIYKIVKRKISKKIITNL